MTRDQHVTNTIEESRYLGCVVDVHVITQPHALGRSRASHATGRNAYVQHVANTAAVENIAIIKKIALASSSRHSPCHHTCRDRAKALGQGSTAFMEQFMKPLRLSLVEKIVVQRVVNTVEVEKLVIIRKIAILMGEVATGTNDPFTVSTNTPQVETRVQHAIDTIEVSQYHDLKTPTPHKNRTCLLASGCFTAILFKLRL